MREAGSREWINAKVPGSVMQDLLQAGKMEDPFWRENELSAKQFSEKDYEYKKLFAVSDSLTDCDRIYLQCQGVDTIAEVTLNGNPVMQCDNMHMELEADVTEIINQGENMLCFHFTSPYRHMEALKKRYPGLDLERHLFQSRLQFRKAASMFGWDWGPALADMGIWRPIRLRGYKSGRILEVDIRQKHAFQQVTLECRVRRHVWKEGTALKFSLYAPDGTLLDTMAAESDNICFVVNNPELWWCLGYGSQPLYRLEVSLLDGDIVCDQVIKRIGLRTLSLRQEQDEWGKSFYFVINNVEVFARGGNYIPEDSLYGRHSRERTHRLLEDCLRANFNMIRVWGGGVYPADYFYEYCDEHGLLVWQDFMFANVIPLWMGEEKENMIREIRQVTRRLRHHPCLAILNGNNETELMMEPEWVSNLEEEFIQMYRLQFEVEMPALVHEEAPDLFYWPSSPSSGGGGRPTEDMSIGDTHDWKVWHGRKPFTYFRSTFPRFNSEFGLQSFPALKTIESFTLPGDRNIFSPVMENHQKSLSGNEVINNYVSQYFRFPKDLQSFIYLSQAIQLEGIRYGVEHWRRNRGGHRCMGALYWQINDCWPVASWSGIDYFGRWKALHYGARRFYAPVLLSVCEDNTSAEFHLSNETLTEVIGIIEWRLIDGRTEQVVDAAEMTAQTPRLSSTCITRTDFSRLLPTAEAKRSHYLAYRLTVDQAVLCEGTVLFVPAKHYEFRDPGICCEYIGANRYRLTASRYAKFVALDFEENVRLSDNYFDLVPGYEKIVTVEEQETIDSPPTLFSLYHSIQ